MAQKDYLHLNLQDEPEETQEGQAEVEVTKANRDIVQRQLPELVQQTIHGIEACNEAKDVVEEEFESVNNRILLMESRLQTKKVQKDFEILGVWTLAELQDAMLQEFSLGIHILQSQDNQIVSEATDLFSRMRQQLETQSK